MRNFSFYEFVGVLIPGVLFLFGLGYFAPDQAALKPLLLPENLGSAVVHVILAYAIGHLVQALGNLVENAYWYVQSGMPTDWPFSRPTDEFPAHSKDAVYAVVNGDDETKTVHEWRRMVATARSAIASRGLGDRLLVFNGYYGMFRGIVAVGVFFMLTAWCFADAPLGLTYVVLVVATGLALYRMHRFAKHYAKEFFACTRALRVKLEQAEVPN